MTEKALAIREMSLNDTMALGATLAESGYFSDAKQAAQAVVKILAGREIGFGPIASMTGIHIASGRVTLGANIMAAAVKRSGRYNYRIAKHDMESCEIVFFENGAEIGRSLFTIQDAKTANLTTGPNKHSWTKFRRNMLFARAMSNGVKWYCPDVFYGAPIYAPEELGAVIDGETGEIITDEIVKEQPSATITPTSATTTTNGNGSERPLSPDKLREFLHQKAGDDPTPITEAQIPFVARKFTECFAPDKDATKFYHLALHRLWGVTSANDLTRGQAQATLDWLLDPAGPDASGDTPLHKHAPDEARRVYRAALTEQGQQELEL